VTQRSQSPQTPCVGGPPGQLSKFPKILRHRGAEVPILSLPASLDSLELYTSIVGNLPEIAETLERVCANARVLRLEDDSPAMIRGISQGCGHGSPTNPRIVGASASAVGRTSRGACRWTGDRGRGHCCGTREQEGAARASRNSWCPPTVVPAGKMRRYTRMISVIGHCQRNNVMNCVRKHTVPGRQISPLYNGQSENGLRGPSWRRSQKRYSSGWRVGATVSN
jgi:hypothetical protein